MPALISEIETVIAPRGLMLMGALPHPQMEGHSIALIGADTSFWQIFTDAAEYRDGGKDPVDRWSKRVIGALARSLAVDAIYPSDGPPYAPFIAWTKATGRFWDSPTGMLVHDRAGLMISIRGALILPEPVAQADAGQSPCATCSAQPCASACPVGALSDRHSYDVPLCKQFLATLAGQGSCMQRGCQARMACPISAAFDRPPEQSAFHMEAFKGA